MTLTPEEIAYQKRAEKRPLLKPEEEIALARAWREYGDEKAFHELVLAYERLASAISRKYLRWGIPESELLSEAKIGLLKAAKRFDPERGTHFSTYAVWWIRASLQDYILRNWSMVRIGTTVVQKKLFFNFRRVRNQVELELRTEGRDITTDVVNKKIAAELGVSLSTVIEMSGRLVGRDFSLDAPVGDSGDEDGLSWLDTLEDNEPPVAETVQRNVDLDRLSGWLQDAMATLNPRERKVIVERKLCDEPRTFESLSQEFGLSRERVRQIELQALKKLRGYLERSPVVQELIDA